MPDGECFLKVPQLRFSLFCSNSLYEELAPECITVDQLSLLFELCYVNEDVSQRVPDFFKISGTFVYAFLLTRAMTRRIGIEISVSSEICSGSILSQIS